MRDALALQIVHNFDGLADIVSIDTVHILLGELLLFYQIQKSKKVSTHSKLSQQMQFFFFSSDDYVIIN